MIDPLGLAATTVCEDSQYGCRNNYPIKPDRKMCHADCWDAYRTYNLVSKKLGYIPSLSQALYMTMSKETMGYYYLEAVHNLSTEAVARTYYWAITDKGVPIENRFYNFLAAWAPWTGKPGEIDSIVTTELRANKLIAGLASNFYGWGSYNKNDNKWEDDLSKILDTSQHDWASGVGSGRHPWNWWGPFVPKDGATFGPEDEHTALYTVTINSARNEQFWIFTYNQIQKFTPEEWTKE